MHISEPDVAATTDQGVFLHDGTIAFVWNEKQGFHLLIPQRDPERQCPMAYLVMAQLLVEATEEPGWAQEKAEAFKNRTKG